MRSVSVSRIEQENRVYVGTGLYRSDDGGEKAVIQLLPLLMISIIEGHLFNKSSTTTAAGFAKIQDIVLRALESDENYNLLFVGRLLPRPYSHKAFSR